jgi:hypothetical protein
MKEIALEIDAQANESRDMFAMSNSQDQSVIDQQLFSFMECQVPRIQDFLTRFISREAANQLDLVAPGVQTSISMPSANTLNIIIREQENLVDFAEAKERIFDEVQAMQDNEVEDDSDSEISDGTGTQVIGPSGGAENLPREQSDTEDTSATIVIALEGQMRDADLSLVPEEPEASIQSNDQSNTVFSPDQTSNTMAYPSECNDTWPLDAFLKIEPMVQTPFLTQAPRRPYTLVLDLDETLIHYLEEVH